MPAKQIDENIYLEDDYNDERDELNEEKPTPQVKGRKPKSDDEEEEEEKEDGFFGLKADDEEE